MISHKSFYKDGVWNTQDNREHTSEHISDAESFNDYIASHNVTPVVYNWHTYNDTFIDLDDPYSYIRKTSDGSYNKINARISWNSTEYPKMDVSSDKRWVSFNSVLAETRAAAKWEPIDTEAEVHHKDKDLYNNSESNTKVLWEDDHQVLHAIDQTK